MPTWMEQILNSETVQQIRFRGILGKLTLVAVVAIVAAVFEVRVVSDWHVQIVAVAFAGVIALAVLLIVGVYSLRHPGHATLEGHEMIAMTRLQMAKKDDPLIALSNIHGLNELSAGALQSSRTEGE